MNKPIGVFDSGVGGLTVVKELMEFLPHESIIYFGDTARVPYGIKSAETVTKFSLENILFLLSKEVKYVVIACNTVSSLALPALRRFIKIPMSGVISPGVKEAVSVTRNKRIGVIATRSTIKSKAYIQEVAKIDARIKVFSQACPLFVPLAEEGWIDTKVTEQVAQTYLRALKRYGIDTLILGCTHYPLLKHVIARVMGKKIRLVDSARQVALEVHQELNAYGLSSNTKHPFRRFYVSDEPALFQEWAERFLGRAVSNIQKISNV